MKKYLLLLLIIFCTANSSYAHKIRIFAYVSNNDIICETQFSGDKPAQKANITVYEEEKVINQGVTNSQGIYSFPSTIAQGGELRITVNSGDGHRGQWLMHGDEYSHLSPKSSSKTKQDSLATSTLSQKELEKIIHDQLRQELAPIKRNLAALQEPGPSLKDILGGVGYIIGLAGIAAYYNARKKERKK